jgi:DNA-nicking Smr family endonuclease
MTSDEDSKLFRETMADVKPAKPDNKVRHKPASKKTRKNIKLEKEQQSSTIKDVFSDIDIEDCPDLLEFSRSGVQPSTLKKLRLGKLPVDHTIDLHGMTVNEARKYLLDILGECEIDGSRCIIIVHGKGLSSQGKKPVIKPMVNKWLRELNSVLAFHSAKPADGGRGAVYVLLKQA